MMRTWNTYQFSGEVTMIVLFVLNLSLFFIEELLFQKKISGGVKKNGGQGDVVVVGFTSHRFRLDEEDLRDPVRRRIHGWRVETTKKIHHRSSFLICSSRYNFESPWTLKGELPFSFIILFIVKSFIYVLKLVVCGSVSRLEEIGFYFNMRYFEDTVTVGEFGWCWEGGGRRQEVWWPWRWFRFFFV